jgi:carbamoyl-phosphate synthase small subunit
MSLTTLFGRHAPAVLALADGSLFSGISIGAEGVSAGEVVFNTAMTGYQEILTDPSYAEQLVTLTYPHIGNTGVNPFDVESSAVHAAGLLIRDASPLASNWRSVKSLEVYLKQHGVVAMAEIDTRRLTRRLRTTGPQAGCLMGGKLDVEHAQHIAKTYDRLTAQNFTTAVSTDRVIEWTEGSFDLSSGRFKTLPRLREAMHIVAYDYGIKHQILRSLVDRGCRITLVPADFTAEDVLAYHPDGLLFSNGPGDPAACDFALAQIGVLLKRSIPVLGICLGFQLLALAFGARSYKMDLGHHGANHPVKDLLTGDVMITSQNHGFAIDENSLPPELVATHRSLFDNTLQGFAHRSLPILAFQGHPEASPGPHDIDRIFDRFANMMKK